MSDGVRMAEKRAAMLEEAKEDPIGFLAKAMEMMGVALEDLVKIVKDQQERIEKLEGEVNALWEMAQ